MLSEHHGFRGGHFRPIINSSQLDHVTSEAQESSPVLMESRTEVPVPPIHRFFGGCGDGLQCPGCPIYNHFHGALMCWVDTGKTEVPFQAQVHMEPGFLYSQILSSPAPHFGAGVREARAEPLVRLPLLLGFHVFCAHPSSRGAVVSPLVTK